MALTLGDWIALATAVATVAAVVVAVVAIHAQSKTTRKASNIASVSAIIDRWNSSEMLQARKSAAPELLDGKSCVQSRTILEYLEWVGYLVREGAVTAEGVWEMLSDWALPYFRALKPCIAKERQQDPTYWSNAKLLADELREIERRRRGRQFSDDYPTEAQMRRFLEAESKLVAGQPQLGPSSWRMDDSA